MTPLDRSTWDYTVRIGHADDGVVVWQILGESGEEMLSGVADDIADATVQVARAILTVHDELDELGDGEVSS